MTSSDLTTTGLCVLRSAVEAPVAAAALHDVKQSLEEMLRLPGRAYDNRHFLRYIPAKAAAAGGVPPSHQRDYAPVFSPPLEALLRAAVAGPIGRVLEDTLGRDAELYELTAIASDPGATEQYLHADATFDAGAPLKVVTLFLALHDILDLDMGPTRFSVMTHHPSCFSPDNVWLPPPDAWSRPDPLAHKKLAASPPAPVLLAAGDAALMFSTTWHGGGGNTSKQRRHLLSFSFIKGGQGGAGSEGGGGGKEEEEEDDDDKGVEGKRNASAGADASISPGGEGRLKLSDLMT